jgi:hypothetical protein
MKQIKLDKKLNMKEQKGAEMRGINRDGNNKPYH